MKRSNIFELHYITHINNLGSIIELGILSHSAAQRHDHITVAMPEVQERRAQRRVPGGRSLHDYANLYITARNPMMYKRRGMHLDLCVIQVSVAVLDLPGVVVADGNASSDYTAFWPVEEGLAKLDKEMIFAQSWDYPDPFEKMRRARIKCAEVLVPDRIAPQFILGVRTSCLQAARSPTLGLMRQWARRKRAPLGG